VKLRHPRTFFFLPIHPKIAGRGPRGKRKPRRKIRREESLSEAFSMSPLPFAGSG
jgi:hypothetical protein